MGMLTSIKQAFKKSRKLLKYQEFLQLLFYSRRNHQYVYNCKALKPSFFKPIFYYRTLLMEVKALTKQMFKKFKKLHKCEKRRLNANSGWNSSYWVLIEAPVCKEAFNKTLNHRTIQLNQDFQRASTEQKLGAIFGGSASIKKTVVKNF